MSGSSSLNHIKHTSDTHTVILRSTLLGSCKGLSRFGSVIIFISAYKGLSEQESAVSAGSELGHFLKL